MAAAAVVAAAAVAAVVAAAGLARAAEYKEQRQLCTRSTAALVLQHSSVANAVLQQQC
jgi:hypothetical protein